MSFTPSYSVLSRSMLEMLCDVCKHSGSLLGIMLGDNMVIWDAHPRCHFLSLFVGDFELFMGFLNG